MSSRNVVVRLRIGEELEIMERDAVTTVKL